MSPYSKQNKAIRKLNDKLVNLVRDKHNVKILDLSVKSRNLFTTHGLHFNHKGKKVVCEEIKEIVSEWSPQEITMHEDSETANKVVNVNDPCCSKSLNPPSPLSQPSLSPSHSQSSKPNHNKPALADPLLTNSQCNYYDNSFLAKLGFV